MVSKNTNLRSDANGYHSPSARVVNFTCEQTFLMLSYVKHITSDGPEGYKIDDELTNW